MAALEFVPDEARLPRSTGSWAVARTMRRRSGRARPSQEPDADHPDAQLDDDGADRPARTPHVSRIRSMTRSVESPSKWSRWLARNGGDLLRLVVVAADGVEQLLERADDATGNEVAIRRVEVAARDVLLEIEREEEHRPIRGGELVHDRRVVRDSRSTANSRSLTSIEADDPVDDPVAQAPPGSRAARARTGASGRCRPRPSRRTPRAARRSRAARSGTWRSSRRCRGRSARRGSPSCPRIWGKASDAA